MPVTHCGPYVKEDRGCKRQGKRISGRCVDCHLEVCLEEVWGGIATLRLERTHQLIQGLHGRGASPKTIAQALRLPKRTVYRVLDD